MVAQDGNGLDDPRARAALTKRLRTQAALIDSADSMFSARGWAATRMEDIAASAGVSAATAYNHFPSKHVLVATVFRPHIEVLERQARNDIARDTPVLEALGEQIDAMARMSRNHRGLTAAFTAAALEYTIRVGAVPDPSDEADPRVIANMPAALVMLVEHGQRDGVLRPDPSAEEIAGTVVNVLLVRCLNRKDEPAQATAALLRKVLFRTMQLPGPSHRTDVGVGHGQPGSPRCFR